MVNILDEIKALTRNVDFSIGKNDLVKVARENGLPAPVIGLLERFTDKEYQSEKEVKTSTLLSPPPADGAWRGRNPAFLLAKDAAAAALLVCPFIPAAS